MRVPPTPRHMQPETYKNTFINQEVKITELQKIQPDPDPQAQSANLGADFPKGQNPDHENPPAGSPLLKNPAPEKTALQNLQSGSLRLPELLNMPPKILPMLTRFNHYTYLYAEGGRGSAKTHSVARFLLFLASKYKLRIVCGRETQNSIEESVYTVLCDLIDQNNLYFEVQARKIIHRLTGATFTFKGFREQGSVSIKGLEGVDILWIDEAQSVTKATLDVLIPTIRKEKSKVFFTMNRFMIDDAVHEYLFGREDCLHIHINFYDNPFCPLRLKAEAEQVRLKSQRDYDHIYLGKPLSAASDFLFNYDRLHVMKDIKPFGDLLYRQRVIGFDFAAEGDDQCVATILDRVSAQHWQCTAQIAWDDTDPMVSVGKIVDIMGKWKPDAATIDVGGQGNVVHSRLSEIGVAIQRFDGAGVDSMAVDSTHYGNARAQGYYELKNWTDEGTLITTVEQKQVVKELEKIRFLYRSNGQRMIEPKKKMKGLLGYSPDYADSMMMAVWAARHHLGSDHQQATPIGGKPSGPVRKTTHRRR